MSHHLMTIREGSVEFGVSIGTLYGWVILGRIPHVTTSGGLFLIRRAAVQRAAAELRLSEPPREGEHRLGA